MTKILHIPILNSMVKYRDKDDIFDAFADGTRRRMIKRLARGGAMSLSKLADPFNITLPAAFKHMAILENAGITKSHKRGRIRICLLNPKAREDAASRLKKLFA